MTKVLYAATLLFSVVFGGTAMAAQASSPASTYLAYHKAFGQAKTWAEVFPYMVAKTVAEVREKSAKDQARDLGFLQLFNQDQKNLKVVSEKTDESTSTVEVDYCSGEGRKGRITAQLVEEKGAWKIGKSNSTTSTDKC